MSDSESPSLSREAWRALGIGFALAFVFSWIPITGMLFSPLVTLMHELGHAGTAWVFGYPAIPSFDFSEGGGVTATLDRVPFLLVVPYALLVAGMWRFRRHPPTWLAFFLLGIAYSIAAFSTLHTAAMIAMGHGGELLMAAVFISRAMSGTTLLQADERPAYAMCGFLIWMHDARFFSSLAKSRETQEWYNEGKSYADNDLVILAADHVNMSVSQIAFIFLVLSLGVFIVPRLAYKYEGAIEAWRIRALDA